MKVFKTSLETNDFLSELQRTIHRDRKFRRIQLFDHLNYTDEVPFEYADFKQMESDLSLFSHSFRLLLKAFTQTNESWLKNVFVNEQ